MHYIYVYDNKDWVEIKATEREEALKEATGHAPGKLYVEVGKEDDAPPNKEKPFAGFR